MNFDKTLIYLTSDPQELLPNSTQLTDHPTPIILRSKVSVSDSFFEKKRRFNKEILKVCLQISGVKDYDAYLIADQIFQLLVSQAEQLAPDEMLSDSKTHNKLLVLRSYFESLLEAELRKKAYNKLNYEKFELAFLLTETQVNMIILLGGTSGTGKSSVASLLATKIGIPTVLSTDSVRHIMRNFLEKDEYPLLFASTYEAGKKLPLENDTLTEKQRTMKGYQMQSGLIQEKIESLIEQFNEKKESIVIEGVHLTPDFMKKIARKHDNCVPFLIFISNESKHKERFAVRSKYMTLDERFNKYIENFQNIRIIQKCLIKKSNENLISKVDNTNIDKSMGLILKTIMSYFRKVYIRKETIPDNNHLLYLYEEFNKINKNVWSSQAVKDYVTSKVNRVDLLNMKMENLIENLALTIEGSPNSIHNEKLEIKSETKDQIKFNENYYRDLEIPKPENNLNIKKFDQTSKKKSEYSNCKTPEMKKDVNLLANNSKESLKENVELIEDVQLIENPRAKIQIKDIRELLQQKHKISLDKNISHLNLKKIKKILTEMNKKSKKEEKYYRLHILKTNERFVIFKRTNSLKEMGLFNKDGLKSSKPNFEPIEQKPQLKFKHLSKDDSTGKNDDFYGITSGTDEEELSSASELRSNDMKSSLAAESMEVNLHGTFKGCESDCSMEEMLQLSEHDNDSFKIEEEIEDKMDDSFEEEQNSVENSDNKSLSSESEEEKRDKEEIKKN